MGSNLSYLKLAVRWAHACVCIYKYTEVKITGRRVFTFRCLWLLLWLQCLVHLQENEKWRQLWNLHSQIFCLSLAWYWEIQESVVMSTVFGDIKTRGRTPNLNLKWFFVSGKNNNFILWISHWCLDPISIFLFSGSNINKRWQFFGIMLHIGKWGPFSFPNVGIIMNFSFVSVPGTLDSSALE